MSTQDYMSGAGPDDGWDVEVHTGILTFITDTAGELVENRAHPSIPLITVTLKPQVLAISPDGGAPFDVFARDALTMGMRAVSTPEEALTVDLPGWRVTCGSRDGGVIDSRGDLWASGVAVYPMWRSLTELHDNRAAVFYAPGLATPDIGSGDPVPVDLTGHLRDLARDGHLLGGMAPVTDTPSPDTATTDTPGDTP